MHGCELAEVEKKLTVTSTAEIQEIDASVNVSAKKRLARVPQARERRFLIIYSHKNVYTIA